MSKKKSHSANIALGFFSNDLMFSVLWRVVTLLKKNHCLHWNFLQLASWFGELDLSLLRTGVVFDTSVLFSIFRKNHILHRKKHFNSDVTKKMEYLGGESCFSSNVLIITWTILGQHNYQCKLFLLFKKKGLNLVSYTSSLSFTDKIIYYMDQII